MENKYRTKHRNRLTSKTDIEHEKVVFFKVKLPFSLEIQGD